MEGAEGALAVEFLPGLGDALGLEELADLLIGGVDEGRSRKIFIGFLYNNYRNLLYLVLLSACGPCQAPAMLRSTKVR